MWKNRVNEMGEARRDNPDENDVRPMQMSNLCAQSRCMHLSEIFQLPQISGTETTPKASGMNSASQTERGF